MENAHQQTSTNEALSADEQLEAMLLHEGLQAEMGSLAVVQTIEGAQSQPDQIKLKRVSKRLDTIKSQIEAADDMTLLAYDYESQSRGSGAKLDILDRKFDNLTRGASQTELIDLYNATAIAHGEGSALLRHIAERIDGNSAKVGLATSDKGEALGAGAANGTKKPEQKEGEEQLKLPNSFAEAKAMKGNSIEDLFDGVTEIDHPMHPMLSPLVRKLSPNVKRAPEDKAFFTAQNIEEYEKELVAFAKKMRGENKYEGIRSVTSPHTAWLQFDSKAFISDRIERHTTDEADARIYLNPRHEDLLTIYKEIFTEAEKQGLRFKSKVFDLTLRQRPAGRRNRAIGLWEKDEDIRIDPILIYTYADSREPLLQIVNDVYKKYASSFQGRRTGAAPIQVAPGYAVGSEPRGHSGQESLTSHRSAVLEGLLNYCNNKVPGWEGFSEEKKKSVFCKLFRANVDKGMKHNIDPENIAFDFEAAEPAKAGPKSPERQEQKTLKERHGLPGGFKTEKGSVYRYDEKGRTRRHKFDHTETGSQRMGLAVFYPDNPSHRRIASRLGTVQGHLPKEKRNSGYIIEEDKKDQRGYRIVENLREVRNSQKLRFALIQGSGAVLGSFPVSVVPQKGAYVFEVGRDKSGHRIVHPGHRVTDILVREEDAIRAWGKLARRGKLRTKS